MTKINTRSVAKPLSSRTSTTNLRSRDTRSLLPRIQISDSEYSDGENEYNNNKRPETIRNKTPRKSKPNAVNANITPPKLRKIEPRHLITPQKGDNKDEENIPQTPSTLLKKLALASPLKNKNVDNCNNRKDTVYKSARKALHSSSPTEMPAREIELKKLREFLEEHLEDETSASMYISGPPGTGKTALLNLVLQDFSRFKQIYVNCTSIKSSASIYSRIVKELGIKKCSNERDNIAAIDRYLTRNHKMTLLILDEIDQLESKKQSVLYTIFEWPSHPNSKLVLIGIANALDLTDRTLPRLQSRCELKPQLMHFAPYTKAQIVEIFTARLRDAGVLEVFTPAALQMLAAKVAAVSGDVRRALDIGRRVIDLIDSSKNHSNILKPIENLADELIENENNENKIVELKQVVDVLNNVYGTTQNLQDEDSSIPLQQKVIICSLILMVNKAKNKDVTVGKLHEVYKKVCKKRNIGAVDQAEFVGLCSLIETRGIIKLNGKKEPRLQKVSLEWDQEEISSILKDKHLIASILLDTTCLGNL